MEIQRDALLRVVTGTRMAMKLAEAMKKVVLHERTDTVADAIVGQLSDAVFLMIGEKLDPSQDFMNDSVTMSLLGSEFSDSDATDELMEYARHGQVSVNPPKTLSRDEFRKMVKENGGYLYETPEGDWSGKHMKKEDPVIELCREKARNMMLKDELKACAADLCKKCGRYKYLHETAGACDGCQWHELREGHEP